MFSRVLCQQCDVEVTSARFPGRSGRFSQVVKNVNNLFTTSCCIIRGDFARLQYLDNQRLTSEGMRLFIRAALFKCLCLPASPAGQGARMFCRFCVYMQRAAGGVPAARG